MFSLLTSIKVKVQDPLTREVIQSKTEELNVDKLYSYV